MENEMLITLNVDRIRQDEELQDLFISNCMDTHSEYRLTPMKVPRKKTDPVDAMPVYVDKSMPFQIYSKGFTIVGVADPRIPDFATAVSSIPNATYEEFQGLTCVKVNFAYEASSKVTLTAAELKDCLNVVLKLFVTVGWIFDTIVKLKYVESIALGEDLGWFAYMAHVIRQSSNVVALKTGIRKNSLAEAMADERVIDTDSLAMLRVKYPYLDLRSYYAHVKIQDEQVKTSAEYIEKRAKQKAKRQTKKDVQ